MESSSSCAEHYGFVDVFLQPFLSHRTESKQYRVPCRKEGKKHLQRKVSGPPSATPKPRSMNLVMTQPRSISLVSREVRMSSYFSSRDMGDFESQGNVEVGKDRAGISIWKQMASTSPYPAEQSQVWKLESTQESKG